MENFIFNAHTKVYFGKGMISNLKQEIHKYGTRVLLVYGGGSIKKNGIYEEARKQLADCEVYELSGVEPNPKIDSVRAGVLICKEHQVEVVVAIGGGSTIDCAKVIAAGYYYEKDPWDLVTTPSLIEKVLPIMTVLTIAATGSEMNKNAVISDPKTNQKLGTSSMLFIPTVSILDPEYLYTLPPMQTAAGTADMMSHIFENYFKEEQGTFVQDQFAEGLLKTCIKYCPIALKDPRNYEARANLMWTSTLALNGLIGAGKGGPWICHPIEHELSAFYDITHGVGLAIITPRWMRYILNESTLDLFVRYGRNVWNIEEEDPFICANMAIDMTEEFFLSCGIPMTLNEIGIGMEHIHEMAEKSVRIGGLKNAYVPLDVEDVEKILYKCCPKKN